jgi:hypothetical protein
MALAEAHVRDARESLDWNVAVRDSADAELASIVLSPTLHHMIGIERA